MKLDDVEAGKQIQYDFYLARNLVSDSENSQPTCALFHTKRFSALLKYTHAAILQIH